MNYDLIDMLVNSIKTLFVIYSSFVWIMFFIIIIRGENIFNKIGITFQNKVDKIQETIKNQEKLMDTISKKIEKLSEIENVINFQQHINNKSNKKIRKEIKKINSNFTNLRNINIFEEDFTISEEILNEDDDDNEQIIPTN